MRLIDADMLREEVYSWGMNDYEPSDFTDAIDDAPTIEAIPKDQYEQRLKSDMVAMLEEIKLEIEDNFNDRPNHYNHPQRVEAYHFVFDLIQNKINAMRKCEDLSININSEKIAILKDIYTWINNKYADRPSYSNHYQRREAFSDFKKFIQEKINSLKENKNESY